MKSISSEGMQKFCVPLQSFLGKRNTFAREHIRFMNECKVPQALAIHLQEIEKVLQTKAKFLRQM